MELGQDCRTMKDCAGAAYCEFSECACEWAPGLGGEDCEQLTNASIFPVVAMSIWLLLYLGTVLVALRGLMLVWIRAEFGSELRQAFPVLCCLGGAFGKVVIDTMHLADVAGARTDKLALNVAYYMIEVPRSIRTQPPTMPCA